MQAIECRTREEWLRARQGLITASDAAAALGLSPWTSPLALYTRKLGLVEDFAENESMKWGRSLQSGIGARFAEVTGREVTPAPEFTIFTHKDAPFVGCTLDFWEKDEKKGEGVLETKATSHEWAAEAPIHYQVQLQIQMACVGKTLGTLAAFQGLRKPPAWVDIEPNSKFLTRCLAKLEEFQWRVTNKQPPPVADGLASTSEALALLYPREQVPTVGLPPEAAEWTADLAKLESSKRAIDEEITRRRNQIKAAMGDAELGLLVDGSAWSWRVQERAGYTVQPSSSRVLRRLKGGR